MYQKFYGGCKQCDAATVHFIEKFTFHDHGTIMITSYYEKYYGVITITLRLQVTTKHTTA